MLKRAVSIALCSLFIFLLLPAGEIGDLSASATEYNFGDRILYGGTAVDIGETTVISENGATYRISADQSKALLAPIEAKYINDFGGRLYFISENKLLSASYEMTDLFTVRDFGDESVKCLYAVENGFYYLRGETVFFLSDGEEREIVTRNGIVGFVPETSEVIRYIVSNPDYVYTDQSGSEIWTDGSDEFISYYAFVGADVSEDIAAGSGEQGTALANTSGEYTGPVVQVGDVTLPLENHMPGTYFSKNGQACTCHNTSATYCIQSAGKCNCMRYYPTGKAETCEVDLLGAQCFAFARMIFWKCFGFIDHSMNQSLYYSVGSLSSGAVTANSVKNLLMKAAPGAHIRLAAGHSVSILTMDEDFIVIYHGNAGGDGVISSPCIVSTRRYTWEQFATAAAKGILYVNMPYNYPDSEVILSKKEVGFYKLKANLNLRAETNTQSGSLCVIPNGTIIEVTEIDGFWGKTEFGGFSGWVFLEYTTFYTRESITPSGNLFKVGDGYLRAAAWKMDFDSFSEHFDKQNLQVTSAKGEDLTVSGYIGSGSVVKLTVNGKEVDSATVCLAGDVNCNGILDVGDYILIKRMVLNTYQPNAVQSAAADVSGNKTVDTYDYIAIRRYFIEQNISLLDGFYN